MNRELRDKWVKELREGGHKQCKSVLHNGEGYCCLGVFERFVMGSVISTVGPGYYELNGDNCGLDPERLAEIGMGENDHNALARKNDLDEKTFPEIADWIEGNL